MTLDIIIPRLIDMLRTEYPDEYLDLLETPPLPSGCFGNPSHEFWESPECMNLYEDLLTRIDQNGGDIALLLGSRSA
jgi:hypothetical protein